MPTFSIQKFALKIFAFELKPIILSVSNVRADLQTVGPTGTVNDRNSFDGYKLKQFGTDKYTIILIVVILEQNVSYKIFSSVTLHSREQNMYIY